jgi:hypothetical protein
MTLNLKRITFIAAVLLVLNAGGCATAPSAENLLVTAGFKAMPATTPRQQQLLRSLTPDKITTIVREGLTYFVFPDLKNNAAYVGRQREYDRYRQLRLAQHLSDQNLEAARLNREAMNNWGGWGGTWSTPWGGGRRHPFGM